MCNPWQLIFLALAVCVSTPHAHVTSQLLFSLQTQFVKDFVVSPLESLLSLFQDPLHLISKRKDKLLDYDHLQYAYEHAEEPDKIKQLREESLLAKRNYEALNTQLLEELPNLLEIATHMLQHQLTVLVQAQYAFHTDVSKLLYPFCEEIEGSAEIHTKHVTELAVVSQKLTQLSLVPASLAMNFTLKAAIPKRGSEGSLSSSEGVALSPRDPLTVSSPPSEGVHSLDEELEDEPEEDQEEGVGVTHTHPHTPTPTPPPTHTHTHTCSHPHIHTLTGSSHGLQTGGIVRLRGPGPGRAECDVWRGGGPALSP